MASNQREQPLSGLRILVVDDEFLILVAVDEMLRDAGAETVCASTLRSALLDADAEPLSAALLDVRLGRETTEQVADRLAGRGVPFVFCSGQSLPDSIRGKHPRAKLLAKPIQRNACLEAILGAVDG